MVLSGDAVDMKVDIHCKTCDNTVSHTITTFSHRSYAALLACDIPADVAAVQRTAVHRRRPNAVGHIGESVPQSACGSIAPHAGSRVHGTQGAWMAARSKCSDKHVGGLSKETTVADVDPGTTQPEHRPPEARVC